MAGLTTTLFPAASAAGILNIDRVIGKFHGVIAPTTPSGSRVTNATAPVRPREIRP